MLSRNTSIRMLFKLPISFFLLLLVPLSLFILTRFSSSSFFFFFYHITFCISQLHEESEQHHDMFSITTYNFLFSCSDFGTCSLNSVKLRNQNQFVQCMHIFLCDVSEWVYMVPQSQGFPGIPFEKRRRRFFILSLPRARKHTHTHTYTRTERKTIIARPSQTMMMMTFFETI